MECASSPGGLEQGTENGEAAWTAECQRQLHIAKVPIPIHGSPASGFPLEPQIPTFTSWGQLLVARMLPIGNIHRQMLYLRLVSSYSRRSVSNALCWCSPAYTAKIT